MVKICEDELISSAMQGNQSVYDNVWGKTDGAISPLWHHLLLNLDATK